MTSKNNNKDEDPPAFFTSSSTPHHHISSSSEVAETGILSLYTQFNDQLNAEIQALNQIEENERRKEDSIPTRNLLPITPLRKSTRSPSHSISSMSSYYFGYSSAKDDIAKGGKTKISVSIIGDAFVDLFCFLNDGSSGAEGGKLPVLGGDVRINQPGSLILQFNDNGFDALKFSMTSNLSFVLSWDIMGPFSQIIIIIPTPQFPQLQVAVELIPQPISLR